MATNTNNRYSDFGVDFIPSPDTGNISIKNDASSIKQALANLIMIGFGEKPFHPEIGFGLRNYLFENMTPITIAAMRRHIEEMIVAYEPRVDVISIDFRDMVDTNALGIDIFFKALNLQNPIKLDFIIQRIR